MQLLGRVFVPHLMAKEKKPTLKLQQLFFGVVANDSTAKSLVLIIWTVKKASMVICHGLVVMILRGKDTIIEVQTAEGGAT